MPTFREKVERIIFESDTRAGRDFDIALIGCIVVSVILVILESVPSVQATLGKEIYYLEWFFTVIFSIEFIFRVYSVKKPLSYIFSFFGIIDILAILPTYLSLFIPGAQSLLIIRVFRLLRVFRIFRLAHFLGEGQMLLVALGASAPKITVFLMVVLSTVLSTGALMYVIEGPENGFTSIPMGIYWAIVTMTTVGYGDISPMTPLGRFVASCLMITGYGVIAVPTGIVTTELARATQIAHNAAACFHCNKKSLEPNARFCPFCGNSFRSSDSKGLS